MKDVVLDCLLDFLPEGVNKEKIATTHAQGKAHPPPTPEGPGAPRRAGRECASRLTPGAPVGHLDPACAPWLILLLS